MKKILLAIVLTAAAANLSAQKTKWTVPRTVDGQPDLQGTWANNNVTPLERPAELAGKPTLTDAELAMLKARSAKLFNGDGDAAFGDQLFAALLTNPDKFVSTDGRTGDYNQFWLPDRVFDNRTSLITDPPDGRVPPLLPAAQRRLADALVRPAVPAGPEDRSVTERCITFGIPRTQAAYMSYYDIVQSRDTVVLRMETIHDARIIPLDGRPHPGSKIRNWLGDSRGHWEGDTLVVDTTNFSPKSNFRGSRENLHLVERFTRVAPERLEYAFTVSDDTTWSRPWSAMIPLLRSKAPMYEYACHEGNLGLAGILSGARAEEREQP
ncbi:MAG TPA: hypothetical protein VFP91_07435 [Vicinamibacterales bacterium]|nr:hypothetical protein [Vicinamibacterales bacterium]